MKPQQARDLFSAAYDEELTEAEQREFAAALAADPQLQKEYDDFRALLSGAPLALNPAPPSDLMPGIRRKLRQRRGARHGDRLGQLASPGRIHPLLLGMIILTLIAALWLLLSEQALWRPAGQPVRPTAPAAPPLHD